MPIQFPAPGSPGWFRMAEQLANQHDVDIKRLWNVTPQVPDAQAGIAFTGPVSPTSFFTPPSPTSASSASSGG